MKKNGLNVWMWKYDGDLRSGGSMMMLKKGGGEERKDLKLEKGGVYKVGGKRKECM